MRRKTAGRLFAATLFGGAGVSIAASWVAGRALSKRLISAEGLVPAREQHDVLLAALRGAGVRVEELRHAGSLYDPVELAAIFASPGPEAAGRPTLLFLHGTGGNAAEWRPEALRALACGYNVLLPDLRGHGQSGGRFVTHGFLEKEDLANAIACTRDRHGIDAGRLGVHGCSAGASLAIEFAANRYGVRALGLAGPYAVPQGAARHYLSRGARPPPLLPRLAQ